MTAVWASEKLKWLARHHELRRRQLDSTVEFEEFPDPGTSQVALVQVFQNVLDQQTTPAIAAQQISEWVFSVPDDDACYDISIAYFHALGLLVGGAQQLSSMQHLRIFADLALALGDLPYVYNTKDKALEFDQGANVIQPGERIGLASQTGIYLWPGLPGFADNMADRLRRGPQRDYSLHPISDQQQLYRQEEEDFTNLNTFAALVAKRHPAEGSPLNSCLRNAYGVFEFLEAEPTSARGQDSHRVARAATTWLDLAGQEMIDLGAEFARHSPGHDSLWKAQGGDQAINARRLRFWQERFRSIREDEDLSEQRAVKATIDAEAALEKLIAAQGWT